MINALKKLDVFFITNDEIDVGTIIEYLPPKFGNLGLVVIKNKDTNIEVLPDHVFLSEESAKDYLSSHKKLEKRYVTLEKRLKKIMREQNSICETLGGKFRKKKWEFIGDFLENDN